jgi:hypothetical protein
MSKSIWILSAALGFLLSFVSFGAQAVSSLQIKIRKVGDAVGIYVGEFIELQMFADGQADLAGHALTFWQPGPSGPVQQGIYTFPSGVVLDGTNQRRILFANNTVDGVVPDFLGGLSFTFFDPGAVCFDSADCVAWGTFPGSNALPSPVGTPIPLASENIAIERKIAANCPLGLDAADDTDDSTTDFFITNRTRHNNANAVNEVACIFYGDFE